MNGRKRKGYEMDKKGCKKKKAAKSEERDRWKKVNKKIWIR